MGGHRQWPVNKRCAPPMANPRDYFFKLVSRFWRTRPSTRLANVTALRPVTSSPCLSRDRADCFCERTSSHLALGRDLRLPRARSTLPRFPFIPLEIHFLSFTIFPRGRSTRRVSIVPPTLVSSRKKSYIATFLESCRCITAPCVSHKKWEKVFRAQFCRKFARSCAE